MDFSDSADDAAYRTRAREWLTAAVAALPPAPPTMEERLPWWQAWQRQLVEAGYAGLSWPNEYGGQEASLRDQAIFLEEHDAADAPDRLNMLGEGLAGPMIIDFGTDEQKSRYLPAILSGDEVWCQLFSEPGAGSDLAALDARAERVEGGFRITGQKVWSSRAQVAARGILLARTGPAHPGKRHKGITCFALDMKSEGITIRPLHHLLGEAEFNEVFLDDVFVPGEHVVGEVDGGWRVAMATLAYERVTLATGRVNMRRLLDDLIAEVRADPEAREDPVVRRTIADIYSRVRIHRLNALRALASMAEGQPGPSASLGKLMSAPLLEDMSDFAMDRHGLAGQLDPDEEDGPAARWLRLAYQARGTSIAGGTTFIQKNIVGERVLGLPR